jgi:hypothetical protein
MKTNGWATRFGHIRREKDKALLKAVEEQIAQEEKAAARAAYEQDAEQARAAIARAFGRQIDPGV